MGYCSDFSVNISEGLIRIFTSRNGPPASQNGPSRESAIKNTGPFLCQKLVSEKNGGFCLTSARCFAPRPDPQPAVKVVSQSLPCFTEIRPRSQAPVSQVQQLFPVFLHVVIF